MKPNKKYTNNEIVLDSDFFDIDETAYDENGKEIHKDNVVIWTDPETGRKVKYKVYEEPTSGIVKLHNKYGECEAFPEECLVIG